MTYKQQHLQASLHHWQIAFNGQWEDAVEFSSKPSTQEISDLSKRVLHGPKDVAIEAFFGDRNTENFFFTGVRVSALTNMEKDAFFRDLFNSASGKTDFESINKALSTALQSNTIMTQTPAFLELGAEGAWKSYGSYQVWEKENSHPPATIDEIAKDAPQLLKPFERAIMLEVAWTDPQPMWLGVPVSKKQKDGFCFSHEKYKDALDFALLTQG